MTRQEMLQNLEEPAEEWDVVVIGGGATGLGTAVEAAGRGYRTLLVERDDFAKGTSSRSTKLIHGGVRYLQQGNIALVLEALRERGLLFRNAPHLVRNLSFVVPLYDWWEGPFYGIGLKLYDVLAGKLGLGPSMRLTREETIRLIPTVEPNGLRGGISYHDGQFDDARLAVNLAQTLADLGGLPLNYMEVIGLMKKSGLVEGVIARDRETGRHYEIRSRVVVNATGAFTDALRRLDDPAAADLITPSQGAHLVLDRSFLPGDSAIMVPHTDDGRLLFAVPWHDRVIIGTTDTRIEHIAAEPRPLAGEVEFLLTHAARYLTKDPTSEDVLSAFCGVRPLVRESGKDTAAISRDHTLCIADSGFVTITGGKWTTYRRMGEDAIDAAAAVGGLAECRSMTRHLRIHGWQETSASGGIWSDYGADADSLAHLAAERPEWGEILHPRLPYRACEIVWSVRREWARTVEDVLARRTRALFLDARASMEIAPFTAELMAAELGRDKSWEREQVDSYCEVASGYLVG